MHTQQRRKRVIERTREDILEAAVRAFTNRGFESATMRDIAQEAGYTAASLYTYFKSKQEILDGLVALVTEEFAFEFDEGMPEGLSFRQKLELLTQRQLANTERRRDLYALLMALRPAQGCQPPPDGLPPKGPLWHMEIQVERLTAWLKLHATAEDLGGHEPEVVARFVLGIGHGFLSHWVFTGPPGQSFTKNAQLLIDLMLHGIQGARGSNGGHDA